VKKADREARKQEKQRRLAMLDRASSGNRSELIARVLGWESTPRADQLNRLFPGFHDTLRSCVGLQFDGSRSTARIRF
jgi:hypothetical protein